MRAIRKKSSATDLKGAAARRGVFLVVALICLMLSGALIAVILKGTLVLERHAELGQRRVQAEWLTRSGLERAAARLQADPQYAGETWLISSDELAGGDGARVVIRVETVPEEAGTRAVSVQTEYPPEGPQLVRRTREARLTVAQELN